MPSHVYLAKDNGELVCQCSCREALITFPPQMDCPWCGCGWLFTCIECRKAFTFARGVRVAESWEELARRDLTNRGHKTVSPEDIDRWVTGMQQILADVEVGKRYVCLDGAIIPADAGAIQFEGWHSRHDLDFVPQVAALKDPAVRTEILSSTKYWEANALPRE
jgi:hypothetical protein